MADKRNPSVEEAIAACAAQVDHFEKMMDDMAAAALAEQAAADENPSLVRRIYRGVIGVTKKLRLYDMITRSKLFKNVAETGVFAALGRRK